MMDEKLKELLSVEPKEKLSNGIYVINEEKPTMSKPGLAGDSLEDKTGRGAGFYSQIFRDTYVLKLMKPQDVIVDVGCGKAAIMEFLYRNGCRCGYVGVDAKMQNLERRVDVLAKIQKTDFMSAMLVQDDIAERLPLKDGSVDVVLFLEVIEHFPKEYGLKLLIELNRILKLGGVAVISSPNASVREDANLASVGHMYEYPLSELLTFVEAASFKPRKTIGLSCPIQKLKELLAPDVKSFFELAAEVFPSQLVSNVFSVNWPEHSKYVVVEATKEATG